MSTTNNIKDLFLLYVTTEKADGTKTSTWMANAADGGYLFRNTPSTKDFRYYTREQANEIKRSMDRLEKLTPFWGSDTKTTYKVMSLTAAVNLKIKLMKERMELRKLAGEREVGATRRELDKRIRAWENNERETTNIYI